MSVLHSVLRKHTWIEKDGLGDFVVCESRFRNRARVRFRPALAGAGWHSVPLDADGGWSVFTAMGEQDNAFSAMALLREAKAK